MSKTSGFGLGKWLVTLGIIAAAGALGYYILNRNSQPATGYQTAPVTRGSLTQAVTATGTLNPVLNVQVGSQVSGNIQKLFADWNSRVTAGQVVAQIDPSNYRANVMQAEGDLANARAALELAQIQVKRSENLRAKDSTPQASLDQAIATEHQAEASVKTKEGSLALAKANLEHCTIISPVDGIVISRNVDVGQTVAASLNAPIIFVIANDLAKMQIDSNVSEADVGNVKEGEAGDFTVDAYPGTTFHGKVRQVRNAAITVQNVVTYDAVIDVDNSDLKLKPGMTANVSIIIATRDDALKIGNAALRVRLPEPGGTQGSPQDAPSRAPQGKRKSDDPARRSQRTVYLLPDGEKVPKAVQIKTGINDGIETEVLEGLNEGDKVVTAVLSAPSAAAQAPANPFSPQRRF
ncbi:MAG: efflux RND transporter periplasmic adaptor subunit [Verrucomicrobiota bacterium]